jgi:hypothetical protein
MRIVSPSGPLVAKSILQRSCLSPPPMVQRLLITYEALTGPQALPVPAVGRMAATLVRVVTAKSPGMTGAFTGTVADGGEPTR